MTTWSDAEVLRHLLGRARSEQEVHDHWGPICSDATADAVGLGWWVGWSRSDGDFLGMRRVWTEHRAWDDPLPGADQGEVVYETSAEAWSHPELVR